MLTVDMTVGVVMLASLPQPANNPLTPTDLDEVMHNKSAKVSVALHPLSKIQPHKPFKNGFLFACKTRISGTPDNLGEGLVADNRT